MRKPAPRCAIFLMGPTGSGKTDLSLRLCEHWPCEIISVDSALVYRGMDIGSAKPVAEVRRQITHHLIDILDPNEVYSAAEFRKSALVLINEILSAEKVPLLVGGTMFYFHALEHGLDDIPESSDEIKRELAKEEQKRGLAALYNELKDVDVVTATRLHPNDAQRIKRALGVYRISGQALSEFQLGRSNPALSFQLLKFGLHFNDREILHANIARRFDIMLKDGLVDEVSSLMLRGDLRRDFTSIRAVGYSQVWSYLLGECQYNQMRTQAISATRQLAKRQLTWMRGMNNIHWREIDDHEPEILAEDVVRTAMEFSNTINLK